MPVTPIAEIADQLLIAPAAVKSHLHSTRTLTWHYLLRPGLQDHGCAMCGGLKTLVPI